MRLSTIMAVSGAFLAAFSGPVNAASSYGRAYGFGFRNGNLVRNWSFESLGDNWFDESGTTSRFLAKRDGITAVSGSYVAKHYSPTNTTGSSYRRVTGEYFPVESGVVYTFSCYVKTSGNTANTHPYLTYYLDRSGSPGSVNGAAAVPNYPVNANWTLFSFQFNPAPGTEYVQLSLLEIPVNQGGTFYFDDVVIESGVLSASNRDSIAETVSFLNDAGQALQTQEKVKGGGYTSPRSYLVQSDSVDYQLRNLRNYASYVRPGLADFDVGFAANAKSYASPSNGRDTLQDFPFSSVEYGESWVRPIVSSSMPGEAWNPWTGTRKMRSGSYFTNSLTAPTFPATEVVNDADLPYLYTWSRGVEGDYSLAWKNGLGQVIQTAVKPGTAWLYTRYEYFPNGRLKKVLQDSDVPGDDENQDFRQVTNYNSAGEVTSTYTKDKGLRKFWYNRLGQLRFSRHESQPIDAYDYISYDSNDRPYSLGVQVVPNLGTTHVEQRDTPTGKTEHKGSIYDNLGQFQSRTGILLSDIMPIQTLGVNGEGRVVCEYNLNNEVSLPASFTAKDRLVATFYNYNLYGEITDVYKYIGAVRDIKKRIHRVVYFYDNNHRLYQTMLEDNGSTPLATYQHYDFDELGRIVKVTGASGKFYSSYKYYDWGGLKSVIMGGTGTSTSGTRMDFSYHAQGWVKEIRATQQSTNAVVFQQLLGYEAQAVATNNIPAVAPKYDGSIAQQLVKFANDLDNLNPIRVTNYQYDSLDRMLVADTRKNSGTPPWDANKQIIFSSLNLTDTEDQDSRFSFDNLGRIATNQSGVAANDAATYSYQGNSYKLDHVSGKLSADSQRDASASGTFDYDARGRMTADASKNMSVTYGWDDMPTQFDIQIGDTLISDREIYDAQGKRVSRVRVKTQSMTWVPIFDGEITILVKGFIDQGTLAPKLVQSFTDVNLLNSGDRRWVETYDDAGTIIASSGKAGVFGISGQIGELNSDGNYQYFVKNHLGSIMRTVGENGEYIGTGNATDYLANGTQKKLKIGSEEQVQSFTGKEQEDATGEYAFGARWYDPDLSMWMSPDPVGEYANPYSYVGGDILNRFDPDGRASAGDKDVVDLPGSEVTCPDDGPPSCSGPPPTDPYLTALEVAGGLAVIMAWENRDWIEDAVGGWFSGGRPSRNFYAESKPPLQNAVNTTQSIAYPNYGGFSLVPNSTSLGTIAEIPINKRFDYFWNRGKTRVAQSRYPNYQDGETYYDAQELIGGIWDMAYGVSYYGTSGLSDDDNTSYSVMPDYVAGPGGAPKLVGQSSRIIYSAERNIQKFFTKAGHGEAFGLKGNWNPGRIVEARDAIGKHINDPNTKTINGRFLGQNVIHYLNPNNGLNIMSTLGGDFIQGYKLGEEQLRSLLLTGRLY